MRFAVVALVAALLVGCTDDEPPRTGGASRAASDDRATPRSTASAHPTPATPRESTQEVESPEPTPAAVPDGFGAVDSTFVSANEGWFLGWNGLCNEKQCVWVVRTRDGGDTWDLVAPLEAAIRSIEHGGCSPDPTVNDTPACVANVRFAPDGIHGWAYGYSLFATDDAGATWRQIDGGGQVVDLEVSGGNVVRLVRHFDDQSEEYSYSAERAQIGSDEWETLPLDLGHALLSPDLARAFPDHLWVSAGGLWLSEDDGDSWTSLGGQCANHVSPQLSPAGTDHLWMACSARPGARPPQLTVSVSDDSGRTWTDITSRVPYVDGLAAISPESAVLVSEHGQVLKTDDRGQSWRTVYRLPGYDADDPDGNPGMVGFVDPEHGRIVANGAVWFTEDGGETWRDTRIR